MNRPADKGNTMKITALAALILLGPGLSLAAQEGQTWATLQGGEAFRKDTNVYQNGMAYGVGGGTWFSDHWGLDLKALRTVQPARYIGYPDTHEYLGLGSLLFKVGGTDHWMPYLAAGAGGSRLHAPYATGSTKLNEHAGIGLMGHSDSGLTLQLDAKVVNVGTDYDNHFREVLTTVGIGYTWGVRHAVAAAPMRVAEPEPMPPAAAQPPPAPPVALPPPPPPPPVVAYQPPVKIVLDETRLHFANGKADIDEAGRAAIRNVAQDLKAYQGAYRVVVTGYASHTGGKAFNLRLSRERAEAVARVLREERLPAQDITVVGKGWDDPIADEASELGQSRNRRVEVEIKTEDVNVSTKLVEEPILDTPAPVRRPKAKHKAGTGSAQ
jgi:outer membrane protein OmpA-like peptidoglycan-associated protein